MSTQILISNFDEITLVATDVPVILVGRAAAGSRAGGSRQSGGRKPAIGRAATGSRAGGNRHYLYAWDDKKKKDIVGLRVLILHPCTHSHS